MELPPASFFMEEVIEGATEAATEVVSSTPAALIVPATAVGAAATSSWIWSIMEYTGSVLSAANERVKIFAKNHKKALIITSVLGGITIVTAFGIYRLRTKVTELHDQHLHKLRWVPYQCNIAPVLIWLRIPDWKCISKRLKLPAIQA